MREKTLSERWAKEELISIDNCKQCKTCRHRDKIYVTRNNQKIEEVGWRKCFCRIYGRKFILGENRLLVPYLPIKMEDKPSFIEGNRRRCIHYIRDRRTKEENQREYNDMVEKYKQEYIKYYGLENLNERGIPIEKDEAIEETIWEKLSNVSRS